MRILVIVYKHTLVWVQNFEYWTIGRQQRSGLQWDSLILSDFCQNVLPWSFDQSVDLFIILDVFEGFFHVFLSKNAMSKIFFCLKDNFFGHLLDFDFWILSCARLNIFDYINRWFKGCSNNCLEKSAGHCIPVLWFTHFL